MSCRMFDDIMKNFGAEGLDEEDVQFIKDLILGKKPSQENGRPAEKAFLFEVGRALCLLILSSLL